MVRSRPLVSRDRSHQEGLLSKQRMGVVMLNLKHRMKIRRHEWN
jgi:hypothetical protein